MNVKQIEVYDTSLSKVSKLSILKHLEIQTSTIRNNLSLSV